MIRTYRVRADGTVASTDSRSAREEPFLLPESLVPSRLRQGAALGLLLFMMRTGAKQAGRTVEVAEDGADVVVTVTT